jgi:hypothetical protein
MQQKNPYLPGVVAKIGQTPGSSKSFLLLFSKKEALPYFPSPTGPGAGKPLASA